MKAIALFSVLLLLFLTGCSALGAPTDQAPGWVQTLDKLNGVVAKMDATTGKTVVTQTTPDNPLSQTGPIGAVATFGLGLAWYMIRKLAAAHSDAIGALANSSPATVTTTTPVSTTAVPTGPALGKT
jgi:hypothetical protein